MRMSASSAMAGMGNQGVDMLGRFLAALCAACVLWSSPALAKKEYRAPVMLWRALAAPVVEDYSSASAALSALNSVREQAYNQCTSTCATCQKVIYDPPSPATPSGSTILNGISNHSESSSGTRTTFTKACEGRPQSGPTVESFSDTAITIFGHVKCPEGWGGETFNYQFDQPTAIARYDYACTREVPNPSSEPHFGSSPPTTSSSPPPACPPGECCSSGSGGQGDGNDGGAKPEYGKPISAIDGSENLSETDYVSADGILSVSRFYSSGAGGRWSWGSASTALADFTGRSGAAPAGSTLIAPLDVYAPGSNGTVTAVSYAFPLVKNPANASAKEVWIFASNGARTVYTETTTNVFTSNARNKGTLTAGTYAGGGQWLLQLPGQGYQIFNAAGELIQQVSPNGSSLSFASSGTTLTVTAVQSGRSIVYQKSSIAGQYSSVTLPDSRVIAYSIDTLGRLAGVTYPGQLQPKTYLYGEAAHISGTTTPNLLFWLTGIQDELGSRYATIKYAAGTGAVSTELAGGVNKYQFSISGTSSGNSIVTKPKVNESESQLPQSTINWEVGADGERRMTSMTQPAGSGCPAAAGNLGYDSNGNVLWRRNFNQYSSCYTYDTTRNLPLTRMSGLQNISGASACPTTLPAGGRKTTTQWHPDWRFKTKEAGPNLITTWVYNGQPDPFNGNAVASCAPTSAVLPDGKPIAVVCKRVEQSTTDDSGTLGFSATVGNGLSGNTTSATRTWVFQYNAAGQVTSEDGPRTDVTDTVTYVYYPSTAFTGSGADAVGHRRGDLAGVLNALGQTTSFTLYDKSGNLLESIDPNEVVTRYSYDARGRLHTRTEDADGSAPRTTVYDYDARGLLTQVTFPAGVVSTAAGTGGSSVGRSVTYNYDDAHRLTGMTTGSGDEVAYTLNEAGKVISTRWIHANVAQPSKSPDTITASKFDNLGRLWQQIRRINGVEQATVFGYDAQGNPTTTERPKVGTESVNPKETRQYNNLDQLKQIQDARLGITTVTPKASGDTASVSAPGLIVTTWTTDGFGQDLKEISPDRGTTTYTFDAAGNLAARVDARAITATYTYDALNRLTGLAYSGTGVGTTAYNRAYVWDTSASDAPFPCSYGVGRVCRVVMSDRTTWYAYDAFGNVSKQRDKIGTLVSDHQWNWDGEDRLSGSTTTPHSGSARATSILRDADGRAKSVNATVKNASGTVSQPIVKDTKYRADGVPERTQMGNDKVYQREFDDGGNIKGQQQSSVEPQPGYATVALAMPLVLPLRRTRRKKPAARAKRAGLALAALLAVFTGLAHADETLEYDARGNIKTRIVDGQASTYQVDELDRIKAETGKANQSFGYDANGNRTSDGAATYAIQPNSNRITQRNGVNVVMDAAGNITQDQAVVNGVTVTRNFTYNPANQLESVLINGVMVASYSYNHLNQRARKYLYGDTLAITLYYYDSDGHLIEEVDGTSGSLTRGQVRVSYVWKGDVLSAVVFAPNSANNSSAINDRVIYLESDHLSAPRKAIDSAGGLVWSGIGDAFWLSGINGAIEMNIRFSGQYFDAESGLSYNWHRYYDAQSGRYVQSDPIGLKGGTNTYAYVGGQPTRYTDPLGLYTEVIVWSGVGKWESQFGHISTNLNGQSYSWGPGGWDKQYPSAADYAARQQQFRDGRGYVLNLTPQEEAAFKKCLDAHGGGYHFLQNNCGTPPQECLPPRLGLPGGTWSPNGLGNDLGNSPGLTGTKNYPGPERSGAPFDNPGLWGY
jgi:RHS repeat-associated protein